MFKRGQMTIFIIVGIIIIAGVGLFFAFRGEIIPSTSGGTQTFNPSPFIEECIKDDLRQNIRTISLNGGKLNPSPSLEFQFTGEPARNISYLCYNGENYLPCVNQEPMLFQTVKNEIKNSITSEVESCFYELVKDYERQSYEVESDYNGFDIDLASNRIILNIYGKITYSKTEQTSTIENFEVSILSSLYKLLDITNRIVTSESLSCDFDVVSFGLLYPEYELRRYTAYTDSTIYKIRNENTNEEFRFGLRGCVIPPGI